MTKPAYLMWAMIALAFGLMACNGGGNQTPVPNPQAETRIILASGGGAVFPAGTFAAATEVEVNESLTGDQRNVASFPANSGDLLGATRVIVPVGAAVSANIQVLIAVWPAQDPATIFTIFQYNSGTGMWETTAAASAAKNIAAMGNVTGGTVVGFTANTAGQTGFDATFGIFENYSEAGTGPGPGTENTIPTVSLAADSTSVDPGDTVNLTATGADADGDTLAYSWQAAGGTLGTAAAGGTTNTWSAAAGGAYTVSVAVNDGNGGVATAGVTIAVSTPGTPPPANDPPVWEDEAALAGDVAAPVAGQKIHVTGAHATDPEAEAVTYAWSGDGTFTDEADDETHGMTVFWTPADTGDQTVTLTASDGVNDITLDMTVAVVAYPAAFDFVGYAGCLGCHADKGDEGAGTGWFSTNHSDAIQRNLGPDNAHGYRNPSCYGCHALGWNPNDQGQGYIDWEMTPEYGNIQCEACHGGGATPGMGADHKGVVWNPLTGMVFDDVEGEWVPDDDFDASMGIGCGACHEGSRHGAVEEWAESGHANFALEEEDEDNPGTMVPHHYMTSGSCSKCHSGIQFATIHKGEDPLDLSGLTLDDPLEDHLIGCATCHDPHSNQYEAQLRVDSEANVIIPFDDVPVNGGRGNICIECHNGRRTRSNYNDHTTEGSGHFGPHGNPQGPMLYGVMGADLGNPPVTGAYESEHPHESWNENSCTTCHMYRRPYIDSANPQLWGHNFEPRYERCITCHSNFTDEAEFWAWVEEYQVEIDGMLQAFLDAWPGAWIDGDGEPVSVEDEGDGTGPPELDPVGNAYRAALWNYYVVLNDASRGVHNPTFTKDLLEQATAAVDALPDP